MKFSYTADRAGAYVALAYTVLTQSTVAERGKQFPAFLAHLRRLYPEVYVAAVSTGWAPERKDFHIR